MKPSLPLRTQNALHAYIIPLEHLISFYPRRNVLEIFYPPYITFLHSLHFFFLHFTFYPSPPNPQVTHWQHPRFHAYFPSGNSFPSILGDMLSDGLGCIGFSWAASPACTELETIVLDWLGEIS